MTTELFNPSSVQSKPKLLYPQRERMRAVAVKLIEQDAAINRLVEESMRGDTQKFEKAFFEKSFCPECGRDRETGGWSTPLHEEFFNLCIGLARAEKAQYAAALERQSACG